MTHEVLESDIEIARRALADGTSSEHVAATLVRRGVSGKRAEKLVQDLLDGRSVTPDRPLQASFPGARASGAPPRKDFRPPYPSHAPARRVGPAAILMRLALAAATLAGVGYAALGIYRNSHPADAQNGPPLEHGDKAGGMPKNGELLISLLPDGLHIEDRKAASSTLLKTLVELLGAPGRTNRLAEVKRTVYAFDDQGLLLYAGDDSQAESLVLDFMAGGGPTGAMRPFHGRFKIADHEIPRGASPAELMALKEVHLQKPPQDTTVFGGNSFGIPLLFSYFTVSNQISVIEIDLR
ncbi:MAG TPA: hypothetical protein VHH88_07210 [Verrucomicrobiae bacterium]|nr:hypothetical protein [Verrucomicrobiae bacterium]